MLLKGVDHARRRPRSGGRWCARQADAPPWLATAGAGDVLAGLAGTLLASGLSPLDAGSVAALVHGLAGDAANPGGPVRALAVAHAIPAVVAGLLARGRAPMPERLGPMTATCLPDPTPTPFRARAAGCRRAPSSTSDAIRDNVARARRRTPGRPG